MTQKNLVLIGDSAFAEIAHEYFDEDSAYRVVGFAVEQAFLKRDRLRDLPVVPFESLEQHFDPATHAVHVAVVYTQLNRLRARLAAQVKQRGYALASYISSRAFVWRNAQIGEHCFIFEGNTIQPFVKLGDNIVLWSGNHIGHHSIVRNNCFVSSQVVISGFCDIGENSFLGVNSTIANNVCVGRDNWLGPNTTVMKDTPAGTLFKAQSSEAATVSATRFFRVAE
jgi:sugar O-acyltransferase (sialic acid O-acetyltransferase NeuD family)